MPRAAKPVIMATMLALLLIFSLGPGVLAGGTAAAPQKVAGVDDFMKNVDRYRGTVSLEGVVSAIAPDQQAISLIDCGECQACGVGTCAQLTLPVQWRGPMPAVRDLVRVEGQAREVQGKLRFVADKLEKVRRP